MKKDVKLQNRQYFLDIFDKLFDAIVDEICADYYYRKENNEINNQADYAELLNISKSAVKKLLAKNVNKKYTLNIVNLLVICDKLNIPINFNYQIGLHRCTYYNKGMYNERRNAESDKYTLNSDNFETKEEIIEKYKDCGPTFSNYEEKK